MEALKRKLNSRRGASILLALLFFLLCILVGASVLVAAASNAGKIKSNKEEQQKYLTLSSAMNLLIDELESVEYVGKYTYRDPLCEHKIPVMLADGTPGVIYKHEKDYFYDQQDGELRHQGADAAISTDDWTETDGLAGVLPLNKDLDYIFANNFRVPGKGEDDGYFCTPLSGTSFTGSYTLEFTTSASGGGDFGGLTDDKVRVKVTLRTDGSIKLIATLWEAIKNEKGEVIGWREPDPAKGAYTMEALLKPDPDYEWLEKRLVLTESPTAPFETAPIRWKLKYIFKKEADPNASPSPTSSPSPIPEPSPAASE